MVNWILIVIIVVGFFVLFKVKDLRHRIWTILLAVVVLFFVVTIPAAISLTDLKSFDGVKGAVNLYFTWLGQAFQNVVEITGNAIKLDWGINK